MAAQNCWLPVVLLVICHHLVDGTLILLGHSQQMDDDDISMAFNESGPARLMLLDKDGMIRDGEDMLITPKQYMRLYSGVRERGGHRTVATPWTHGQIPYEIKDDDFDDGQKKWIKKAMRKWEDVSCIRFRPAKPTNKNKLLITTGSGCTAALGMKGGTQGMSLSHGCFWIGTVAHEFGHTIGLIHEHQRPERDGHIRFNYYKVKRYEFHNALKYAKGSDDKMGLPYDYTSLMHYSRETFTKDESQTVYTRDPTKEYMIGMALGPSFLDAKLVNLMYNCENRCREKPSCPADCFVDAYCSCICEKDFPKENCKDEEYECAMWAEQGYCDVYNGDMQAGCRKTCGYCTELSVESGKCEDKKPNCRELAERGECHRDPDTMLKDCKVSCDFCPEDLGQDPTSGPGCVDYDTVCQFRADNGLCQKLYAAMITDCPQACGKCNANTTLPEGCVDNNKFCRDWAFRDECINNPSSMMYVCKQSCSNCPGLDIPNECIDYDTRCPVWKSQGRCSKARIRSNCRKSCDTCHLGVVPTSPAVELTLRLLPYTEHQSTPGPGTGGRTGGLQVPATTEHNCEQDGDTSQGPGSLGQRQDQKRLSGEYGCWCRVSTRGARMCQCGHRVGVRWSLHLL